MLKRVEENLGYGIPFPLLPYTGVTRIFAVCGIPGIALYPFPWSSLNSHRFLYPLLFYHISQHRNMPFDLYGLIRSDRHHTTGTEKASVEPVSNRKSSRSRSQYRLYDLKQAAQIRVVHGSVFSTQTACWIEVLCIVKLSAFNTTVHHMLS